MKVAPIHNPFHPVDPTGPAQYVLLLLGESSRKLCLDHSRHWEKVEIILLIAWVLVNIPPSPLCHQMIKMKNFITIKLPFKYNNLKKSERQHWSYTPVFCQFVVRWYYNITHDDPPPPPTGSHNTFADEWRPSDLCTWHPATPTNPSSTTNNSWAPPMVGLNDGFMYKR